MKESYLISNLILLIIYTILSIAFFSDLVKETDISYVLNKEIKKKRKRFSLHGNSSVKFFWLIIYPDTLDSFFSFLITFLCSYPIFHIL